MNVKKLHTINKYENDANKNINVKKLHAINKHECKELHMVS